MSNLYLGVVVLVGFLGTAVLLRMIFSNSTPAKEVFEALDGTKFSSKSKVNEYEFLYKRLQCIYEENSSSNKAKSKSILGLNSAFLKQIKTDGFPSINSLISNKEQFKNLVALFDLSEMSD